MSEVINYSKTSSPQDAYSAVKAKLTPEKLEKYTVKNVNYDDLQFVISAKGTGFDVAFKFLENHVQVDLNLSLMLRPLKGKIWPPLEGQIKSVV